MISPSGGDDTPIIQAALNAKGYAELDSGDFRVSSLNLTNRSGVLLKGSGTLLTRLNPTQNGVNVIDLTGTSNAQLQDFRIAGNGQPFTPSTGILSAQMEGSAASDVNAFEGVRVDGTFSLAAWFCHGVQSSRVIGGQFYNYSGMAAIMTGNNMFGAASQFVPIRTVNDMQPSDWTIVATEFHSMSSSWAIWLGGVDSVRFYGGNASSSEKIVTNNAVVMPQGIMYPANLMFDGTTFYSDFAPTAPYAVSGLTTEPYITFRNCAHPGMPLTGP